MTPFNAVAFSGGVDSTVLVMMLQFLYTFKPVLFVFDYGQIHRERELPQAVKLSAELGCSLTKLELPVMEYSKDSIVVPFRNAEFVLGCARQLALSRITDANIWLGISLVDYEANFPDCNQEFVTRTNALLQLYEPGFRVVAPFLGFPKSAIVQLGESLRVPWQLTWSCYRGGEKPCGTCLACVTRVKAFKEAGVNDTLLTTTQLTGPGTTTKEPSNPLT